MREVIEYLDHRGRTRRKVMIHTGEGLTEQSQKEACDINNILSNYQQTGFIQHAKEHQGQYDDVSGIEFMEAMNTVARANTMFESLPSSLRNRFNNNPKEFLDFAQNPDNKDQLLKMGVLKGNDGLKADGTPSGAPVPTPEPAPKPEPAPG